METKKSITIVGGGLAGLTLGIGLRQRNVPVTILEAGSYPRHRVCGEFISGRGQGTLRRLGLLELVERAGAVSARTVAFCSTTRLGEPHSLPEQAICISRFILDARLAKQFQQLGGRLIEGQRYAGEFGDGFVRATGRRPQVGKSNGGRIGLKIHARGVTLPADLEMHTVPHGYVGLCKINDGEVNICGLFYETANENEKSKAGREWLRGPEGSPLNRRLQDAEFDEDSFCAVAGLSLRPERAASHAEVSVGDAITMIPPMTGNGMSMAFESAELAIDPLMAWSEGGLTWEQARHAIAGDCDRSFSARLTWANWLQQMMLVPMLQNPLVAMMGYSGLFRRVAFQHTR